MKSIGIEKILKLVLVTFSDISGLVTFQFCGHFSFGDISVLVRFLFCSGLVCSGLVWSPLAVERKMQAAPIFP